MKRARSILLVASCLVAAGLGAVLAVGTLVSIDWSCAKDAQKAVQADEQLGSVVVMECDGARHSMVKRASAVRVGPSRWISARHALEGSATSSVWLVDTSGQAHQIDTWRAHPNLDIASFESAGTGRVWPISPAKDRQRVVAQASDGRTAHLRVIGAELDARRQPTLPVLVVRGRVSPPSRPAPEPAITLHLEGLIQPGFSGGPIADTRGRLVGMSFAVRDDRPVTLAVTAHDIDRFAGPLV